MDRARHRSLLRLCRFTVGAGVLLSLAACCIGSACDQPPPPIPVPGRSPSGAIAVDTRCVMPAGSGECKVTVIYSVQDGTHPTITVGTATPAPVTAGDGTLEVTVTGVGTTPVVLKNGDGTVLDNTKTIGSTCERWSTWNAVHRSCRYHYDRANLVVSGETINETGQPWPSYVGYPQLIVGTTMTPLKNSAGVQVGSCGLSSLLLPSGLPAAWCVKPRDGNLRGLFPVDPVRGLLLPEYTGPIPAGMAYYTAPYGPLGSSPYAALDIAYDGMFIDVPGVGTYYFTQARGDELRLTRDGFKTYEVMQSGQNFHLLMSYSHPAPCEPGFAWDTALVPQGQCSPKLCYAEAYLAISGRDMTPYQVSLSGRVKPVNMTDLPDVCAVSDTDIRCAYRCGYGSVDALGRVVFACQERRGTSSDLWAFSWKRFYWNPVANTWHRYGNEVLTGDPISLGFVFGEDDRTLPPPYRNMTLAPALNGAFLSRLSYWDGGRVEAALDFLEDGKSERKLIFYNDWALSNEHGYILLLRTVRHVCTP
jgi:hypothetical protein